MRIKEEDVNCLKTLCPPPMCKILSSCLHNYSLSQTTEMALQEQRAKYVFWLSELTLDSSDLVETYEKN